MAIRPTKYLAMPDGNDYEFFGKSYYGTCSSSAGNTIKSVYIEGFTGDALVPGVHISVKFTYANDVKNPTLSIEHVSGATPIRLFPGSIYSASILSRYLWADGQIVDFIYDGASWLIMNYAPRIWYGTCSSSSNSENKLCSIDGFTQSCVKEGVIIVINFQNENTANSNVKLQINGTNSDTTNAINVYPSSNNSRTWSSGVHTFVLSRDSYSGLYWFMVDAPLVKSVNGMTGDVTVWVPVAGIGLPSMDGTASAGSNANYSRADHVHPTDTSRQETLVSGTNIKTIGGESVLGSGNISLPTVVSDLTNDAGYITTETDPTVPSWAKEVNPPTYTLTYDQNSSAGSAQVGTAVTGTPNYTPRGEINVTKRRYNVVNDFSGLRTVPDMHSYNNGMWLRYDVVWNANTVSLDVIDDVTFNGAGVNFVIERDDS